MRTIAIVVAAYLAVTALVFFSQRKLLYLPNSERPTDYTLQNSGLQRWPAADTVPRAYLGTSHASSRELRGTVVVLHGNAGHAGHRGFYAQALQPLGFRVLLAEYPGYGGRSGEISEAALVADARQTLTAVHDQYGDPVILLGESLGSGVAAAALASADQAQSLPVAAAILITPWDTLADVAQRIYWYLPARYLVLDPFDNMTNLRSFRGPVAVVVAGQDRVIAPAHGLRLFESLAQRKRLWTLSGAGHNDWPAHFDASNWRELMNFVTGPHG